jgi:hypothetical protein
LKFWLTRIFTRLASAKRSMTKRNKTQCDATDWEMKNEIFGNFLLRLNVCLLTKSESRRNVRGDESLQPTCNRGRVNFTSAQQSWRRATTCVKVENILGPVSRLIVWKSLNSLCGWGMLGLEKKKDVETFSHYLLSLHVRQIWNGERKTDCAVLFETAVKPSAICAGL